MLLGSTKLHNNPFSFALQILTVRSAGVNISPCSSGAIGIDLRSCGGFSTEKTISCDNDILKMWHPDPAQYTFRWVTQYRPGIQVFNFIIELRKKHIVGLLASVFSFFPVAPHFLSFFLFF